MEQPMDNPLTRAEETRQALLGLVEHRREEERVLTEASRLLLALMEELALLQSTAAEAQGEASLLAGELHRSRARLRRAEELLATAAGGDVALPSRGEENLAADAVDSERSPEAEEMPSTTSGAAEDKGERTEPPAPSGAGRFTLEEVRSAQRIFNESPFTDKMRSVRRSLGRPAVGLVKVAGPGSRCLLTVAWEIVWYQYLLDLSEPPISEERASPFAEGMELTELADHFKRTNANLDDDGRLDASELEVSLLHDEDELLTHFSPEQEAALDDATEEIWDKHSMPEFRWDD